MGMNKNKSIIIINEHLLNIYLGSSYRKLLGCALGLDFDGIRDVLFLCCDMQN